MEEVKPGQKYEEFYKERMEEEKSEFKEDNGEEAEFLETERVKKIVGYFARKDYFTYIKTQEFIEKNGREPNKDEAYLIYESYDEIDPIISNLIKSGKELTSKEMEEKISEMAREAKITPSDIIAAVQGSKEAIDKIDELTEVDFFEKMLRSAAKAIAKRNGYNGDGHNGH